jgi:hypothetical protein
MYIAKATRLIRGAEGGVSLLLEKLPMGGWQPKENTGIMLM